MPSNRYAASKCYVPGCRTGYKKDRETRKREGEKKLSLFKAPLDEDQLEAWKRVIPKRKDQELKSIDTVCELHFLPRDIVRYYINKMPDGKLAAIKIEKPSLAPGAVPTIFPNYNKNKKMIESPLTKRMPLSNETKSNNDNNIPTEEIITVNPVITLFPNSDSFLDKVKQSSVKKMTSLEKIEKVGSNSNTEPEVIVPDVVPTMFSNYSESENKRKPPTEGLPLSKKAKDSNIDNDTEPEEIIPDVVPTMFFNYSECDKKGKPPIERVLLSKKAKDNNSSNNNTQTEEIIIVNHPVTKTFPNLQSFLNKEEIKKSLLERMSLPEKAKDNDSNNNNTKTEEIIIVNHPVTKTFPNLQSFLNKEEIKKSLLERMSLPEKAKDNDSNNSNTKTEEIIIVNNPVTKTFPNLQSFLNKEEIKKSLLERMSLPEKAKSLSSNNNKDLEIIIADVRSTVPPFTFNELLRNVSQVSKPDKSWAVSSHEDFIVCVKWDLDFHPERQIIIDTNLSIKILYYGTEVSIKPDTVIESDESLSQLLKEVHRYDVCPGAKNRRHDLTKSHNSICLVYIKRHFGGLGRPKMYCEECRRKRFLANYKIITCLEIQENS